MGHPKTARNHELQYFNVNHLKSIGNIKYDTKRQNAPNHNINKPLDSRNLTTYVKEPLLN